MSEYFEAGTFLFRQVHPSHAPSGVPTSQAFNPTPKDEDLLSVDDSRIFSAEQSWKFFTEILGFKSAGTWALTFQEISEASIKMDLPRHLVTRPDPIVDEDPQLNNPAHCLIDFSNLATKGERKRLAQSLSIMATNRGVQFKAP